MSESDLTALLLRFKMGQIEIGPVLAQLGTAPMTGQTAAADVDLDRLRRCGYPEVVYAPGKTTTAIADVFRMQLAHGQNCLATRVSAEQAGELTAIFPAAHHNATARTLRIAPHDLR